MNPQQSARWLVYFLVLGGCTGIALRTPAIRDDPGLPPPDRPLAYSPIETASLLANPPAWLVPGPPPPDGRTAGSGLSTAFDCTRLPPPTRQVLSLFLLLPLGALVTAVFRTVIGVPTFGTFTPALLALSFVDADWRSGVFIFASVVILGLLSRTLLERLRLLLVSRLSVILTLIVLCVTLSVSLLDYFRFTPSVQAVLLPMIVTTMMVERFYVTAEEESLSSGLRLLAGTAVVAVCCYAVLQWEAAGRILLAYPETHLFTLAALILLGRYTGYRLTELWRFRDFRAPQA